MREKTRGRARAQVSENGQAFSKQKSQRPGGQAPQEKVVPIKNKELSSMPSPTQRIGSSSGGKCRVGGGLE